MIHIACIGEGGYLRHTAAMLHSALSHLPAQPATVHLLQEREADAAEVQRLRQTLAPFGAGLRLHTASAEALGDFRAGYFPRAIWLRVLLPDLLPELDKVLYLDSDMIVADTLLPLWQTELGEALLGAVVNPLYPFMPPHPKLALGLEQPEDYFNSGMLLMNLRAMRADRTSAKLREIARSRTGMLYPDQDALNLACRGRWLALHPRWNAQSTLFELSAQSLPFPPQVVSEVRAAPAVIHYIGPFKPWHYLCRHPHQALYFRHAALTPWGEPALEGRSAFHFVLRRLPIAWIDRGLRAERWVQRKWRRLVAA